MWGGIAVHLEVKKKLDSFLLVTGDYDAVLSLQIYKNIVLFPIMLILFENWNFISTVGPAVWHTCMSSFPDGVILIFDC